MPTDADPTFTVLASHLQDVQAQAPSAEVALAQADLLRRVIAGDSLFSIQRNVTTAQDPVDLIRLQRHYSSEAQRFPLQGLKHKTPTPWTQRLFRDGQVFVGEGAEVLARTFDDYEQMRVCGVLSVINVPLIHQGLCFATFNVFGKRARWRAHEVQGIELLARATARWVPPAPGLAYRFSPAVPATTRES